MTAKNSLERVLSVLDVFTEDRLVWTPDELMAALGYSRPTLYRYLKTLREAGLVTSTPGAGVTLGPRVVEMDYLMRKSDWLAQLAQPWLERLTARHPCTALVVRWYGTKMLCVASECSTPDPISSYSRGRPMPIARGAISRSILAATPRRQLMPLIRENLSEFAAIGLGEDAEAVYDSLRRIKKAGVAIAFGEVTPGVVGVAAPVFDAAEAPAACISVTIAAARADAERIDTIAGDVRRAAADVTARLSRQRTQESGAPGEALKKVGAQ